jgi:hypothetical protein
MTRIGITGHQSIPAQALPYIQQGIHAALANVSAPLDGYSSLAEGADQLFANIILSLGGRLHAVIPAENYGSTFEGRSLAQYRELLDAAVDIKVLPFDEPSEDAYAAAGLNVVDNSDVLLAVWDGRPARGRGGTADAVDYARAMHVPVHVIWPADTTR